MFVLPSFFILYALVWVYLAYGSPPVVAGVLYGIKPAVVAIVLFACYRIGSITFKNKLLWANALFAFISIFILHLPFPVIAPAARFAVYFGQASLRSISGRKADMVLRKRISARR